VAGNIWRELKHGYVTHFSVVMLDSFTDQELRFAWLKNLEWQLKWTRKLEKIVYGREDAPAAFVKYGMQVLEDHQDKMVMIEIELERRGCSCF